MFVLEHGIMNMQSPIALFNAKLAKTANHSATASADSLGGSAIERINDPHIMDKLLATLEPREEQIVRLRIGGPEGKRKRSEQWQVWWGFRLVRSDRSKQRPTDGCDG
ncbi:hypothetical protein ACFSUK_03510 [Sphingobium scionense]